MRFVCSISDPWPVRRLAINPARARLWLRMLAPHVFVTEFFVTEFPSRLNKKKSDAGEVFSGFTRFYWVLLGFQVRYWVLLDFTVLNWG